MIERFEVTAGDGWRLSVRKISARGSGRRAVLCGHAMMTDGGYFTREGGFAHYLSTRGFDVYVPDFRGHGASGPGAGEGGRWSFDDLAQFDWPALRSAAAKRSACAEEDLGVLGHSLGGLVTVAHATLAQASWARTVFLSANVWALADMPWILHRVRAEAVIRVFAYYAAAGKPLPVSKLRFGNADEAPAYIGQFAQWARTGTFLSAGGLDYTQSLRAWRGPAMAVAGSGDWMCLPAGAQAFVAAAQGRIPVHVEGPASGLAFAPNHFSLVTRPDARPFWDRLAVFFA